MRHPSIPNWRSRLFLRSMKAMTKLKSCFLNFQGVFLGSCLGKFRELEDEQHSRKYFLQTIDLSICWSSSRCQTGQMQHYIREKALACSLQSWKKPITIQGLYRRKSMLQMVRKVNIFDPQWLFTKKLFVEIPIMALGRIIYPSVKILPDKHLKRFFVEYGNEIEILSRLATNEFGKVVNYGK